MYVNTSFAKALGWATRVLAIGLIITIAGLWLAWDWAGPRAAQAAGLSLDAASISTGARLAGFALCSAVGAVQSFGLWRLSRTFFEAAAGRALSPDAISGFQTFTWALLALVPLGIALRSALIALISAADSVPGGFVSIHFGAPQLKSLCVALLLVFVAQVFRQGQAAEDENRAFL